MLTIVQVQTAEQVQQFQELVAEYKAWDSQMSGKMGFDVKVLQDSYYNNSVHELVAELSPPDGRLLLASFYGRLVGCAGLRRLSPEIAEMKRVYVRPAFRGRGLGRPSSKRSSRRPA